MSVYILVLSSLMLSVALNTKTLFKAAGSLRGEFPFCHFRVVFSKRLLSGSHSSQSNLSQASVISDQLSSEDLDGSVNSQLLKISDRRSNSSSDIHGERWTSASGPPTKRLLFVSHPDHVCSERSPSDSGSLSSLDLSQPERWDVQ